MSSNFECKICHTNFIRESAFMKHRCKQMIRVDELKTSIGQAAYGLYGKWMKVYNRLVKEINRYMTTLRV